MEFFTAAQNFFRRPRSRGMAACDTWPKYLSDVTYSDKSSLNTLDICIPRAPSSEDTDRFWIVYIHGGAWRDPSLDASTFKTTQEHLLKSQVASRIAGYASLNYRLSPYPSHPGNPSDPTDPARNARHPDHINDVLTALIYLQETYDFKVRYILIGHSCGATLALQVAMKRYWGSQHEPTSDFRPEVKPPLAIVGLEGIYDIPAFVKYHRDQPVYEEFVRNAFGSSNWDKVSPTNADFHESWPDGKLVVLAHSPEDTLVEWEQVELQHRALEHQGWKHDGKRIVKTLHLKGDHNEVWMTAEAARAVEYATQILSEFI